ncbi:Ser-Thr-rich glycosyl-phosphatidyl-inositol-anchored membrane family-domain-containing protein [Ilyonectria robusta]|uniref:Ser-Thr-rich glycosyl-phosphatidyl-inositol-anchored membrane family-domain-containing protein n=1 Tax=Ilyonectria robusta TaxID=1079257 RepID=UPI001E8D2EA2|nr:Ser-Thr-rich glycosyl-phosphatidyl-inositol-anchored membrane family-domain-containing protein [Ilyonectria robusta]KAH8737361.1 Ser-Thr-rich glycosyl-phosphatidyl-inositol-anchored membrane family-domain-containing protein [Ilyonectria robusta]
MQFSAAAVLAFVATAVAQTTGFDSVFVPASGEVVPAGSSFTIEWTAPAPYNDADDLVTIGLIGGATQNTQVPLLTVATGVKNAGGSYTWSVPADLGELAFYGLTFTLESDTSIMQYSNPFTIGASTVKESTTKAATEATSTLSSAYGVKTISLSSQPAAYTTVVPVYETTTVPCTNSTTTPAAYVPPPAAPTTVVSVPSNGTWTTAVVPVVSTTGSYPAATTPAVVTGAGARVGASMAVVAGLVVAVLAL